ncbi:MAG: hypothetical protein IM638_03220 [Bacteroidetes bacterium]|nr:hypothetical protein [Bacteroidota bacterium]
MKQYSGDAIRKMTDLFGPTPTAAYNWLMDRDYRELIETVACIKAGRDASFKWLVDNKFYELAAFANAVMGDKDAFRWLMQNKCVFWAATANAANKDKKAGMWLKQHQFTVYHDLAETIIRFRSTDSDLSGYYKPPVN